MSEIQLPLITLPEDITLDDGIIKGIDGTYRFWRLWNDAAGSERKGLLIIQHGYTEHSERYNHVATLFVRLGYAVFAMDSTGHGRSDGERGNVEDWDTYVHDFELGVRFMRERFPDLPFYFLGHSNGGLTILRHGLLYPHRAVRYCVTSPFCGPKYSYKRYLWYASKALAKMIPSRRIRSKNVVNSVSTHVEAVNVIKRKDPLGFNYMRAHWLFESLKAQLDLLSHADQITDPFLFLVSGDDGLADEGVTRKVFLKLGSKEKEYQRYPGLFHEILNERGWEEIVHRMDRWFTGPRQTPEEIRESFDKRNQHRFADKTKRS